MENKVYYGQYSLRHWINLILKKNIALPEYQRHFAWDEKKVETLIKALKENQFIPPVTIGKFKIDNSDKNLILDGQQRLTSIFLAYLCKYPILETKKATEPIESQDDNLDDSENFHEWTFEKLTELGTTREQIVNSLPSNNYKEINYHLSDDFFDENFIGFSYLVPSTSSEKNQLKYYSSVFRNINIQGITLLPQESRASLYFLDKDLAELFSPTFINNIGVKTVSNYSKLDFVRALALVSQYKHEEGKSQSVASGYKSNMEKYYEEYIYSVVEDEDGKFGKFSEIFNNREYKLRLEKLNNALISIDAANKEHPSIIDLDIFIFGAVYHILLENKTIPAEKIDALKIKLNSAIDECKSIEEHKKNPGLLRNLRSRIEKSIASYNNAL